MEVRTVGPVGSSGKNEGSLLSGATAAAAEAYCLWRSVGVSREAGRRAARAARAVAGRAWVAVRRKEAIVTL